jgi:hypothetical protein
MHTCDVCATPLGKREQDTSIMEAGETYHVCSFTCETIIHERLVPAHNSDQPGFAADQSDSPTHT